MGCSVMIFQIKSSYVWADECNVYQATYARSTSIIDEHSHFVIIESRDTETREARDKRGTRVFCRR